VARVDLDDGVEVAARVDEIALLKEMTPRLSKAPTWRGVSCNAWL